MKEVALLLGLEGNNEEDDAALNNVEETYEDAYVDGEEVAYEVASYEDDEVELYVSLHDEALQHDEGQRHDVVREHGVALGHGVVHDEERDEVHDEGAHVVRYETSKTIQRLMVHCCRDHLAERSLVLQVCPHLCP